jgi:hypothetical protein
VRTVEVVGGYIALMGLAKYPDIFRAAIAGAPVVVCCFPITLGCSHYFNALPWCLMAFYRLELGTV